MNNPIFWHDVYSTASRVLYTIHLFTFIPALPYNATAETGGILALISLINNQFSLGLQYMHPLIHYYDKYGMKNECLASEI